ncbi:MAG: SPOR domain-containing protein, partial [Methylococcales bacterium]|nr:SPOR domain-containing protein [Methylococcales bacterium]
TDDDDWMKQLDGLDEEETEKPSESSDDDDWMKQLDGLDEEETKKPSESSDDDDWMKQLDNLDDHDEDTAKMLMDAGHGHDTDEDEIVDSRFNIADKEEQQNLNQSKTIDEDALITKAAALAISQIKDDQDHAFSQLRADQDTIESKNRKQFVEAENKRKKAATFGYIALGVGVIGVLGSAGIGWMSYGTKNEATNLTETVTTLEEKVNTFLAKNPEKEIENIKTSVEQLNQKVDKIAAAQVVAPVDVATAPVEAAKTLSTTTKPNSSIDLLNSNKTTPTVSTSIDAPKVAESAIVPPIDISPASPVTESTLAPVKAAEPVKLADMAKKPVDVAKEKIAAKAEADKAANDKAAARAEAELLSQKITKANAIAKAAAASNSKAEEQRKLLMQSKAERYSGRMTRGMARGGSEKNSTIVEAVKTKNVAVPAKPAANKEVLNTAIKPQKSVATGKYSVNVISYQQEWFAQSKAAEFKQKGIPVEVVPIDASNPATKFRLKVGGFKNKAEADVYSDKVKKSLNLKETWVGSTD